MSALAHPQTGVSVPVAEEPQLLKPIPENQLTESLPTNSRPVETAVENVTNPQAENFRALRQEIEEKINKINELERLRLEERSQYQKQFEDIFRSMEANQAPAKPKILGDYEDDYVPSVGELRKAFEDHENSLREKMEEIEVIQKYPDYMDVLKNHFAPLVKEKPYLAQMISRSPNKAFAAYELGLMAKKMAIPPAPDNSGAERAQRIVENANKPGNVAYVGGSNVLNQADYYANLSDKDFSELAKRNLGEI